LCELGFKTGGYFVEFGATNGLDLSNTHLLEKEFGWSGIVAEPAVRWHEALKANRSCHVETNCVWRESNKELTFNEVEFGEFSTIDSYSSLDVLSDVRRHGKTYSVNTISLNDMLDKYDAPGRMDYLSIDTEGSEYDILSSLNFDKYQFATISCEHNYTPLREKIFSLLTKYGYVRKLEEISLFDDWYVKAE
jgi:FkbM family methyltransferase